MSLVINGVVSFWKTDNMDQGNLIYVLEFTRIMTITVKILQFNHLFIFSRV
jgi:hypothetical protein